MAIWSFRVDMIGRSEGKSAVAAAAYRSGASLHSDHQGIQFDYSRKQDVAFTEILLSENAPDWMKDRQTLWNAVEKFEKRKDATLAREMHMALPCEFSLEQNKALLFEYLQSNFVSLGMIADCAIHDMDGNNPHAHVMLTLRRVKGDSFDKKAREWNDRGLFESWRVAWAEVTNQHLALNGFDRRIDHRSYAEQGIDLEPTIHLGIAVEHSNKPEKLDRYHKFLAIQKRNLERLLKDPSIAIDLLTKQESIFSHETLCKLVHYRTSSHEEFNQLRWAIEGCKSLVSLGTGADGKHYYTSHKTLEQERALSECALRLSKSKRHQLKAERFKFIAKHLELNSEQKEAFDFILSGNDLSLIVGYAGTGKGYLMNAIREAYEAEGYRVVGAALAGKAADGLAQSAHIHSKTIARFLLDWENGREVLNKKTVLIVDETGMIGTRQLQRLLAEAERVGCKIILCGDPEQIPPIDAGCPFRFLLERLTHRFLTIIIRQKIEWQQKATVQLSTLRHAEALDQYKAKKNIHAKETRNEALEATVKSWSNYVQCNPRQQDAPHKEMLMIAYLNKDVETMNHMARDYLKNTKRLTEEVSLERAKRGKIELSLGERIFFLRNENSLQIKNGMLGTLTNIKGKILTVKMDRGETLSFDSRDYEDFGYGYAATVYKAQGATVNYTFVLATPHLNRFMTNVSLDRHRYRAQVFYGKDDFTSYGNFKRTICRGESKLLAIEFAKTKGLDYALEEDVGALVESKFNFDSYYQKITDEAQPISNTLAEVFLKNEFQLENININSLQFHPSVWERETQSFMPALVAKALGYHKDLGMGIKGAQVHFIDPETARRPDITHPVRYTGSPDAVIMLQKPSASDNRWFVATDLETGLAITKSDPNIRVATIAVPEKMERIPLICKTRNQGLVLCANKTSENSTVEKAVNLFKQKGFEVKLSKPEKEESFIKILRNYGTEGVAHELKHAKECKDPVLEQEIEATITQFEQLNKEMEQTNKTENTVDFSVIDKKMEHFAQTVSRNFYLSKSLEQKHPELFNRIHVYLDRGCEIEL